MTLSLPDSLERLPSGIILMAAAIFVFLLLGLVVFISLLVDGTNEPPSGSPPFPKFNPQRRVPECAA